MARPYTWTHPVHCCPPLPTTLSVASLRASGKMLCWVCVSRLLRNRRSPTMCSQAENPLSPDQPKHVGFYFQRALFTSSLPGEWNDMTCLEMMSMLHDQKQQGLTVTHTTSASVSVVQEGPVTPSLIFRLRQWDEDKTGPSCKRHVRHCQHQHQVNKRQMNRSLNNRRQLHTSGICNILSKCIGTCLQLKELRAGLVGRKRSHQFRVCTGKCPSSLFHLQALLWFNGCPGNSAGKASHWDPGGGSNTY